MEAHHRRYRAKIAGHIYIYTVNECLCVGGFTVAEAIIKLDSLVVALPFDEGRGDTARDLSPHGNDGVLVMGAKWGDGKFGKCLRVKEPARAEVENNESFWLHDKDFT